MTTTEQSETLVTQDMIDAKGVWGAETISYPVGASDIRKWAIATYWPEKPPQIFWDEERGWYRETNHAGGVEGGMTNGEPLLVRAAIKPLSTLTQPLRSVDTETKEPAEALRERTDSTVVPAAAVVGEAMVALILASAYCEKFGGDHIDDAKAALAAYRDRIGWRR